MKRFYILAITLTTLLTSCIDSGLKAGINDLQIVSGISDRRLLLDGCEGVSSDFSFRANHDWSIIDYKGFRCDPSSGQKSANGETITVRATPTKSNNSADTIRLSDLNFKMLSTRFVGISAYQLPQIRMPKGDEVTVEAIQGSHSTITIISSCDDIELVTSGDIEAALSEKNSRNEYTITVTATANNSSASRRELGYVGFKANGENQAGKITVMQSSAIILDRSEVLLPGKAGGENIFVVNSNFDFEVSTSSSQFEVVKQSANSFAVKAASDNKSGEVISLGTIDIALADVPECAVAIEVKQRKAKAPQTIIVHFIGTALQHYFEHNIAKILEALESNIQGESQVIAITTDTTNKGTLYELRYDSNIGKAVQEKVKELDFKTPYNDILLGNTLYAALNYAPAEKYALVIGSHGRGWVPKNESSRAVRHLSQYGLTYEELWKRKEGAEMTRHIGDKESTRYDIEEISAAIEANNVKFDYILFDACFMGNIESVYELRNCADNIIGSPCEVMGYGFPYARVMKYMLANNGTSYDLDKICNEYVNYYRTEATTPSGCVAVTHTAELKALAEAMKEVNKAGIKSDFSLNNVQYYEGQNPHSFYDLGDMVEQSCADAAVAAAFKAQLDKTVTSRYHTDRFYSVYGSNNTYYHDINYYSGMTTSAMVEHYAEYWKNTAWYNATH